MRISPAEARHAETVHYKEVPLGIRASALRGDDVSADDSCAYLGNGSKISGKLLFEEAVRIDGQVDGEISDNDLVVIGYDAIVTAPLKAVSVVIARKMSGDIQASKLIEIHPTAKVFGNLATPVLVVHDGALFEGHCTMHIEAQVDRKVPPVTAKASIIVRQAQLQVTGRMPFNQSFAHTETFGKVTDAPM